MRYVIKLNTNTKENEEITIDLVKIYIYNLPSFLAFVEVNVNSLQLKLIVANVITGWRDAVFRRHYLKRLKRKKNIVTKSLYQYKNTLHLASNERLSSHGKVNIFQEFNSKTTLELCAARKMKNSKKKS